MTFRSKVEKIVLEMLEGKDKAAIGQEIKEKIGKELVTDLTKTFEGHFAKYLTLKGETYIKPLIVDTTKEMIELKDYQKRKEAFELALRKLIREELKEMGVNEPN